MFVHTIRYKLKVNINKIGQSDQFYVCRCKNEVERLRDEVLKQSLDNGGSDSQYVNTPSCQVKLSPKNSK